MNKVSNRGLGTQYGGTLQMTLTPCASAETVDFIIKQ